MRSFVKRVICKYFLKPEPYRFILIKVSFTEKKKKKKQCLTLANSDLSVFSLVDHAFDVRDGCAPTLIIKILFLPGLLTQACSPANMEDTKGGSNSRPVWVT